MPNQFHAGYSPLRTAALTIRPEKIKRHPTKAISRVDHAVIATHAADPAVLVKLHRDLRVSLGHLEKDLGKPLAKTWTVLDASIGHVTLASDADAGHRVHRRALPRWPSTLAPHRRDQARDHRRRDGDGWCLGRGGLRYFRTPPACRSGAPTPPAEDTMNADWFPDPSGRFNQRFFDGSGWTDHVVGANGSTVADPLTGSFPPPPPTAPQPPSPAFHPASASTAPQAAESRPLSWVGVTIAGVGLLLAALSLYALDWADGASVGDIRDGVPDTLPDGLPFADVLSLTYLRWGGLLLLLAVIAALIAVGISVARRDGDGARLLGALVAGTAAALHTITVVRLFRAPGADPAVGAWLGTIGFLVVIVGLAIAAPKDRTSS